MKSKKPEQEATGTKVQNLTFEQSLVTEHTGIDGLPGYRIVVFEKLKEGGVKFLKVVNRDERFRSAPFDLWNKREKYFSLAVNESILHYTFEAPVTLDYDLRKFILVLHLKYRAVDVRRLAELARQDPLKRLTEWCAATLSRSCAQRKWEMIKDRFRELELIVLNAERARLRQFAEAQGIGIIDISLDRHLPGGDKEMEMERIRTSNEKEKFWINQGPDNLKQQTLRDRNHALRKGEIDEKYELRSRDLDRQIELQEKESDVHRAAQRERILDSRDEGIMTVIRKLAENTDSPDDLREVIESGSADAPALPEIKPELRPEVSAEVPEPAKKRWINVEIDGDGRELIVEKVYTLSLDVDITVRDTSLVKDVQLSYGFQESETDVELDVHLSSQDFKIYDDRQKLYVPRTGRSENKARFDIKPLHSGSGTLKALILKDNNFIQELTLTIEVGSGQSGKVKVESKGRPPESAMIVKPRDVHLDISYNNGKFELKVISGKTAKAIIDLSPQAVEKLTQEVRDVWDRIIEKKSERIPVYQVGVDIPERVNRDSLQKLAEAGFHLYKNLFYENQDKQTRAMGDLLRRYARDERLKIQITSDKFFLPWGVLYMAPNLDQPDADMFLGLKHVIEHIPKQTDPSYFDLQIDGNPKFSVSLNLDEGIDEEATAKGIKKKVVAEQKEFWNRLEADGAVDLMVRGKSTDLIDVFRKREMGERLIYFYCHASARMDKSKPFITLGDGKRLTVDDLSNAEGEIMSLPSAPLLFVNACDSADLSPFFYDDFVTFFVSRGARGAIGTECKIPAVFASEWANRFFTRFLPGKSLGELFLELRREFYYKHHNLLGLAYALYCDGDTQIFPGLTIGDAGTVPAIGN